MKDVTPKISLFLYQSFDIGTSHEIISYVNHLINLINLKEIQDYLNKSNWYSVWRKLSNFKQIWNLKYES